MVALGSRAGTGPEFLSNLLPRESHLQRQCVSMVGLPGQATPPWNMVTWGPKRKKREHDVTGTHQHSNSHRSAGLAQVPGTLQFTDTPRGVWHRRC